MKIVSLRTKRPGWETDYSRPSIVDDKGAFTRVPRVHQRGWIKEIEFNGWTILITQFHKGERDSRFHNDGKWTCAGRCCCGMWLFDEKMSTHFGKKGIRGENDVLLVLQVVTRLLIRVICGESPKVNQRRWTKVGHRHLVHPSTPLITSVERNCLHGSLWLIQPCWSTCGTRVNAP